MSDRIHIYQIYYDERTKNLLDPGFTPLDNTANERPDWYELWPMLKFLRGNELLEDHWYGFLSPNFFLKTELSADAVRRPIERFDEVANVAVVSFSTDQVAYFRNLFEQGEAWHSGLTAAAQGFVDHLKINIALDKLVSYSANAPLSNFVIAKPAYWSMWAQMAQAFYNYVERGPRNTAVTKNTAYASNSPAPMKAFVQERLSSIILSTNRFNIITINAKFKPDPIPALFHPSPLTARALPVLDFLKQSYVRTGDVSYLEMYYKIRADVPVRVAEKAEVPGAS